MIIPIHKTIRPTKLQPQLFSVLRDLSKSHDYRLVVDKDNAPLCVMVSYDLVKELDFEQQIRTTDEDLGSQIEEYYSDLSNDEKELFHAPLDDIID